MEVERYVMQLQAAVLRCADVTDVDAPTQLEALILGALEDGCPPHLAVRLLIHGFTARVGITD